MSDKLVHIDAAAYEEAHQKARRLSDAIFKVLDKAGASPRVAFVAMCMCVARLARALDEDKDTIKLFTEMYYDGLEKQAAKMKAEKLKGMN